MTRERETAAQRPGAQPRTSLYGDELAAGALVGEYAIVRKIGAGGCGVVYDASHQVLGRRAAVKVLHKRLAGTPQMVERFVREARAVNRIGHPHIVDIFELGELPDGRPFYVMEFIDGTDLRRMLAEHGRLSAPEALALLEPVCEALDAAHRAGVVHRDLKASNVLVADQAGRRVVKLHDFGIAKLVEPHDGKSGFTSVGERLGSPHSMAPEQIRGDAVDARADVYALGVLLYQLLTGEVPFDAKEETEIERMHLEHPAPRASERAPVAPGLDAIIQRCLAKVPAERFASAPELLDALRRAVRGAAGGQARRVRGVALHLRARLPELDGAGGGEEEDAALDALALVLGDAEAALRGAGWAFAVRAGETLVAVRELPDDLDRARDARLRALDHARALAPRLWAAAAAGGVGVRLCLHADGAVVRGTTGALELVGGPLSDVAAWVPAGADDALLATGEMLADLEPMPGEPVGARHRRLLP